MSALLEEERSDTSISLADINAVLKSHDVTISMVVDAESWQAAESQANRVMRSAIDRAGGRVVQHDGSGGTKPVRAMIQSTELVPA
jgi:hypothetical protein